MLDHMAGRWPATPAAKAQHDDALRAGLAFLVS
jgi:hypothetical protein